jgi:periplasmic copper chaperone A
MTMTSSTRSLITALTLAAAAAAHAQVAVEAPWARPTVPGQQGGGGFLVLRNTSASADRLVGGSTPVAERFELHTMSMKGDVMEMRQVDGIDLPAGQEVVMLIGLKTPLKIGDKVPVTLKFEKAGPMTVQFEVMSRPVPRPKN